MADEERYVRPPSAESEGRAPGRGRLAGRRILIVIKRPWTLGSKAGPLGNAVMARWADVLYAFPERDEVERGSGTWNCIRAFEKKRKKAHIFGEWRRLGK